MGAISQGAGGTGVGNVGPQGPQGPAGPPGPQGPAGPAGQSQPVDVTSTALSVFSAATMAGGAPYPIGVWTPLDFNVLLMDSRQAIQPGPAWQWVAPVDGCYHLLASLVMQQIAGQPTPFELRVLHLGMEEVHRDYTSLMGQIDWLGRMKAGETLRVEIKSTGPLSVQISPGPPRSLIAIAGVGVMA